MDLSLYYLLHHRSLEGGFVPHWGSFLGAPPIPSACSSYPAPAPDLASRKGKALTNLPPQELRHTQLSARSSGVGK